MKATSVLYICYFIFNQNLHDTLYNLYIYLRLLLFVIRINTLKTAIKNKTPAIISITTTPTLLPHFVFFY
jgi:hypothetical protein